MSKLKELLGVVSFLSGKPAKLVPQVHREAETIADFDGPDAGAEPVEGNEPSSRGGVKPSV